MRGGQRDLFNPLPRSEDLQIVAPTIKHTTNHDFFAIDFVGNHNFPIDGKNTKASSDIISQPASLGIIGETFNYRPNAANERNGGLRASV